MTETSDELRKRLKEKRAENGRERNVGLNDKPASDSGSDLEGHVGSSNPTTDTGHGPEKRHADSGNSALREPVKPVRRRTKRDQGHDSPIADSQGKLVSSAGSSAQIDRRTGPSTGRYGEDNATHRADGIDLRTSVSSPSGPITPLAIGNLERNTREESSIYIPPRTFTPDNDRPIVGQPALRVVNGQIRPVEQKGTTRAVEAFKAVIPKPKRGRPAQPRNVEAPEQPTEARKSLGDKLKEAGSAIPSGKKLSSKEVQELKDPLIGALKDEFEMFDNLLWNYEGEQSIKQPIWSDMMDSDVEHLATALLNMGTRSGTAATIARGAVDLQDYIVAGALLAPRFQSTVGLVKEVRKRNNKSRRGK